MLILAMSSMDGPIGGHKKLCGERREISQRVSIDAPSALHPFLHSSTSNAHAFFNSSHEIYQVGSLCRYQRCPIYRIRNLVFAPRMFPSSPRCLFFLISFCSNGRQTVGDGALIFDNEPSVLAVCHLQGTDDMYYYSTTFSGGPGVCLSRCLYSSRLTCR